MKPDGSGHGGVRRGRAQQRRVRLAPGDARAVVHRQRPRHARRRRAERRAQRRARRRACTSASRSAIRATSPDPEFGAQRACSTTEPPVQKLGAHVAAIGFTFYTGNMFPASYKNAAIIAQHGSWNRSTPSGYRVMVAHTDGRRVTGYEPLVEGFLPGEPALPGGRGATGAATRPTGRRAADAGRLDPDQRRPRQSPDPRQLPSVARTTQLPAETCHMHNIHRDRPSLPVARRCRVHVARAARPGADPHRGDDQRHRRASREPDVESGWHGVLRQHGERHDLPRRAGRRTSRTVDSGVDRRPDATCSACSRTTRPTRCGSARTTPAAAAARRSSGRRRFDPST